MAALDTNVLVRLVVEDDTAQLGAALQLINKALAASETLYVSVTVAIELEWVLRASFGFDKPTVLHALSRPAAAGIKQSGGATFAHEQTQLGTPNLACRSFAPHLPVGIFPSTPLT